MGATLAGPVSGKGMCRLRMHYRLGNSKVRGSSGIKLVVETENAGKIRAGVDRGRNKLLRMQRGERGARPLLSPGSNSAKLKSVQVRVGVQQKGGGCYLADSWWDLGGASPSRHVGTSKKETGPKYRSDKEAWDNMGMSKKKGSLSGTSYSGITEI